MRPELKQRLDDFDLYDYGDDLDDWTSDDEYTYYGSNTAESWFSRFSPNINTDWQPTTDARLNSHNTDITAGDLFGGTPFTDTNELNLLSKITVIELYFNSSSL